MTTENLTNVLTNEFKVIEEVRGNLFSAKKIQLHSGMEGFNSPDFYGVYKGEGGDALGVVGSTYQPMDLNVMLDSIVHSSLNCGDSIDLNTLQFKEYKKGAKVAFKLDLPTVEIDGSKMIGDIVKRGLEFRTGFDGKTKSSVIETFERVWCENGCTNVVSQSVAFKNTINNHARIFNLCQYIEQAERNSDSFVTNLGHLNSIKVNKKQIDVFLTKVTGYNVKEYKDLTKRKQNILDAINSAVAIEMKNTGSNLFSLVNGVTRYTTHDFAGKDLEKLYYSSGATMNSKALNLAFQQLS